MSRFVSVVIRNPRKTKQPTTHNLRHNSRLTPDPNYMLPRELRLKNYNLYTVFDASKTWGEWETEIGDLYKEQHLKGRQIRSDAVRLDEGLIVLSEEQVNNCKPDDIWEKMQEYINWFEERFLTVIYTLDWHRDEGHAEEDLNEVQKLETRNNHAHFIFSNVDSNGDMIRRNWDQKGTEFKEMQDQIAKIFKPLGFVRGVNYAKNKILPPEYKTPSEKRREKSKETRKKDKTEIKNLTDMLNQEKEKKWQQRLQKLREKMQLEKANRFKYGELEALLKTDAINYKNSKMQNEAIAENVIWDMKVELEQEKQMLQAEVAEKVNELQGDISLHEIIDEQRVDKINILQTEIENQQKFIKDKVIQIEELENTAFKSEIQQKEKSEEKDHKILSLTQLIQEFKKDVFSETWTRKDKNGEKHKSKNINVVKQLEKKSTEFEEEIKTLKTENNTLRTGIEQKETQITSDANTLQDSQEKIKVLEKQVQELEKSTEPTGYYIEGESVSKKLYEHMEEKRHALNYKFSREESLEEKLEESKQRIVARNNLMKDQQERYDQLEKEYNEKIEAQDNKIESLNHHVQELEKDVFSETWTRKDKNGEKHKSKNINVVKQLEKKSTEFEDIIKTLNLLAYTGTKYPTEFDENDKPVKFEKETWKGIAEYAEEQVKKLSLETEWQSEKILELEDLAYHDEQIYNSEIADYDYITTTYKDENEILEKELDEAIKIIETIRDYNVPISQLGEFWDELKVTVLDTTWEKREESVENEIQQDTIKLKHKKENIAEDKGSPLKPG